jgi:hypothetical protein
MADTKISALPAASTPVAGTEVLPIVQSSTTKQISIANLRPGLGTIPTTQGGTNLTSFTANGVVYASSTSALATGSALTFDGTNLATSGSAFIGASSAISSEKFGVTANVASYMAILKNSGNNANRLGIAIQCGANDASGTNYVLAFDDGDGTRQGQVTFTSGTTTYGTSSDYRLKENIAPIENALDRLAKLKPCKWTWKRDGVESEGFIAHELQEVVPLAVAGEKDAVDEKGDPAYQSVGAANIVPMLTAAIQEQQKIIDDLRTRIAALEQ